MAEAFYTEHLQAFLECSICLEKYDNPKPLTCTHHFCKNCLEDIMTFNGDGSAVIRCPMRCVEQTIINKNQTVNDLVVSYDFKGVLEAFRMKNETVSQVALCTYDKNCGKEISVYCCEFLMCKSCHATHEASVAGQHQRKTHVCFNKGKNKLKVVCDKHYSQCTYLCADGNFLCKYCINRGDHMYHAKQDIETVAELLKEEWKNHSKERENILHFLKITEENIQVSKEKLENLLEIRKEKCLDQYTNFLNKEKEALKKKFDSICDSHMKQYPINLTSNYYQEKLEGYDAALAIEKGAIQDTILENVDKLTLNCETVVLSNTFDYKSDQPLGDIQVTVVEEISTSKQPITTLRHNMKSENKQRGAINTFSKGIQVRSPNCYTIGKRPQGVKKHPSVAFNNFMSKLQSFGNPPSVTSTNLLAKESDSEAYERKKQLQGGKRRHVPTNTFKSSHTLSRSNQLVGASVQGRRSQDVNKKIPANVPKKWKVEDLP